MTATLSDTLEQARSEGLILPSTLQNIRLFLSRPDITSWALESLEELVKSKAWGEINDRFYKTLSFGTGGIRGRTMGKIVTRAEQGSGISQRPDHTAIGTQMVNDWTIRAATQGLLLYLAQYFKTPHPILVFSHDTRLFSRHFAELAADTAREMGAHVYLFGADRSTPELSFAIRYLHAHAGAMITASHNPPHDNGYKAYFNDGGQLVEPHASGVMELVSKLQMGQDIHSLQNLRPEAAGKITLIGKEIDEAYLQSLERTVLKHDLLKTYAPRIIFTPLHGTGVHMIPQILKRFDIECAIEPEQATADGFFSTLLSPNPESPKAFEKALELAKKYPADLILATDPDADRMGACILDSNGKYQHLTGNQIGSILAAYRLETLFSRGILNSKNAAHAAIIKSFVTTDLQKSIAKKWNVRCIETLTGFKYIAAKMQAYEKAAGERHAGDSADIWRQKLLQKSTCYIFGAEESYGFSVSDEVRDKDANAAALAMVEAAAYARSRKMNLLEYLDTLYLEHGLYLEKTTTLTFEGAEGAALIQKLLKSYTQNPPSLLSNLTLIRLQNFADETILDPDGEEIPKELMLVFHLENNFRMVVRASGTEPKIKFYFFGYMHVESKVELEPAKEALTQKLNQLWSEVELDAQKRVS